MATSTPLRVRPRITPLIGARSPISPIVAMTALSSTRSPMPALVSNRPPAGAYTNRARPTPPIGRGSPASGMVEPASMIAPSCAPHIVSIARSTVWPATKFGPRPIVSGAIPRCRSGTARLRMRASITVDQAAASSVWENGTTVTGTTSRAANVSLSSAEVSTRRAVRPSRTAAPSNTASAKAIPRRGAAGAGSSCSATAKPARNSTAATAEPTSPAPRTSTGERSASVMGRLPTLWLSGYSARRTAMAIMRSDHRRP